MSKVKFSQRVSAEMHRFKDLNGKYYLDKDNSCIMVRNKTRIYFDDSDNLIGTVFMTNPGSYGLNKLNNWSNFISGTGEYDILDGDGSPDLTMQNIIHVIQEAYKLANSPVPNGYVDVFNLSSVVCPKSKDALAYHNNVQTIIKHNNLSKELLINPVISDSEAFIETCENSPFIIMGFVKGVFTSSIDDLINWSSKYKHKTIFSLDRSNWYSHPRRWRTEKYLEENVIHMLSKII